MSDSAVEATIETPAADAPAPKVDAIDAALDAAIAKAENSEGGASLAPADESNKGPARGADGKFLPKAKSDAAPAAVTDPESSSRKYGDDEVRAAISAAQRVAGKDGMPKAIKTAIESGDEETIAYYLKLSRVQQDGDEFSKKHKQLQQEFDALKKPEGNGKVDATASPPDLEAATKPLADFLTEQLGGEDAAKHVRESLAGLNQSFASELSKRDQQIAALQKQQEVGDIERARDALISEYPDLKDKTVWENVVKRLPALPESDERPDMLTRLEHAARIELAPELIRRAKAEQDRRNKVRDNGSPTPTARTGEAAGKSSNLHDELLDAYERGDEGRAKEIKAVIQSNLRR